MNTVNETDDEKSDTSLLWPMRKLNCSLLTWFVLYRLHKNEGKVHNESNGTIIDSIEGCLKILNFLLSRATRVDVSETVSADQLWFRNASVLIQRCSLPENLLTALNSSETALTFDGFKMTFFFSIFFQNVQKYLNFEGLNSDFQPN